MSVMGISISEAILFRCDLNLSNYQLVILRFLWTSIKSLHLKKYSNTFQCIMYWYHPSFKRNISFIDIELYSYLLSKICHGVAYQIVLYNKIDQLVLKLINLLQIFRKGISFNYPLLNFIIKYSSNIYRLYINHNDRIVTNIFYNLLIKKYRILL